MQTAASSSNTYLPTSPPMREREREREIDMRAYYMYLPIILNHTYLSTSFYSRTSIISTDLAIVKSYLNNKQTTKSQSYQKEKRV